MNPKALITKAVRANDRYNKAQSEVKRFLSEKEEVLSQAVLFARSLQDLIKIFNLSSEKSTQATAWKKAIFLLAPSQSSFEDMLSILECGFNPTRQEADASEELVSKANLILTDLTVEQWFRVYSCPHFSYFGGLSKDNLMYKAREEIAEIVKNCQDIDLLHEWDVNYRKQNVWGYLFGHRIQNLQKESEPDTA